MSIILQVASIRETNGFGYNPVILERLAENRYFVWIKDEVSKSSREEAEGYAQSILSAYKQDAPEKSNLELLQDRALNANQVKQHGIYHSSIKGKDDMSTRSRIGIYENGVFKTIYCHSDGYPQYVGRMLYENYQSLSKVKSLLALGDLSQLDTTEDKSYAYSRDGGEELTDTLAVKTFSLDFAIDNIFIEYIYIYDVSQSRWYLYTSAVDREDLGALLKRSEF